MSTRSWRQSVNCFSQATFVQLSSRRNFLNVIRNQFEKNFFVPYIFHRGQFSSLNKEGSVMRLPWFREAYAWSTRFASKELAKLSRISIFFCFCFDFRACLCFLRCVSRSRAKQGWGANQCILFRIYCVIYYLYIF